MTAVSATSVISVRDSVTVLTGLGDEVELGFESVDSGRSWPTWWSSLCEHSFSTCSISDCRTAGEVDLGVDLVDSETLSLLCGARGFLSNSGSLSLSSYVYESSLRILCDGEHGSGSAKSPGSVPGGYKSDSVSGGHSEEYT